MFLEPTHNDNKNSKTRGLSLAHGKDGFKRMARSLSIVQKTTLTVKVARKGNSLQPRKVGTCCAKSYEKVEPTHGEQKGPKKI